MVEQRPKARVAVLMTSHNRRASTEASARSALADATSKLGIEVILVDAGSTDGTPEALRRMPNVTVLERDASLYWNAGMREAWLVAANTDPDFFLWLNDDLTLRPGSIQDLVELYERMGAGRTIIVGRTTCPRTGEVTYGGYRRAPGVSRIRWQRTTDANARCDTMNGNCVLLPARVVRDVGIHSRVYRHAFGDIDYGLRARNAGYQIVEMRVPVGEQERNVGHIYTGAKTPFTMNSARRVFFDPKGIPLKEWLYFCLRHAGPLWPFNFVARYAKIFR